MYNFSDPYYRRKVWERYKMSLTIAVGLLLLSLACNAQKLFIENGKLNGILPLDEKGRITYQVIDTISAVSKGELYKRARKWFVKTYVSQKMCYS